MIRTPSVVAFFHSLTVSSLAEAEKYYRMVLDEHFTGVPGVTISPSCFGALSSELDDFALTAPSEHANLWIFEMPDGGAFLTTPLHRHRPGVAFSEFMKGRRLSEELQGFLVQWREMVGAYYALSCLYARSEPYITVLGSSEEALEQA